VKTSRARSFKKVISKEELTHSFEIRREVFVNEQHISEKDEMDGLESHCRHYLGIQNGIFIATARVRLLNSTNAKIERMAVLKNYRNSGVGKGLIDFIENDLQLKGFVMLSLHAQVTAEKFYRKCGYTPEGDHFYEAGIEHVKMVKRL